MAAILVDINLYLSRKVILGKIINYLTAHKPKMHLRIIKKIILNIKKNFKT